MTTSLLYDAIERLIRDSADRSTVRSGSAGEWQRDAWQAIVDAAVNLALVPEDKGGFGIEPHEAANLLRLVGYWSLPLPIGEAMLANGLLTRVDMEPIKGVVTLAPPGKVEAELGRVAGGWRVSGHAHRVAWARDASDVVLVLCVDAAPHLVRLPVDGCELVPGTNLAGEPRVDLSFDMTIGDDRVEIAATLTRADVHSWGAALRTAMIAGAASRILDMSVEYAREHQQFGRPIAAFQAVQQNLAVLGGQVALCSASADLAEQALFREGGDLAIAVAKARVGEAAAEAAHIAHQVHGAIGFTDEYDLHLYTKRIWAWREEFGNEIEWAEYVGNAALAEAQGPWALITDRTGQL